MNISEILEFLRSEGIPFTFSGNEGGSVEGFSSLTHYKPGSFTWVKKQGNIPEGFDLSQLALAFVSEEVDAGPAPNVIRTAESKRAFFSTIEHFYAQEEERPAVGQFTYISPRVRLGKNVRVGHNCTLDGDITIGDDTVIWNNVVIVNRVEIGRNCEIQSGCVIGHDGFGYTEDAEHRKTMVRHFGGVVIEDCVLLSANTCVCRGTVDDSRLGTGSKIDTLCHIAHNVQIEKGVTLISGTLAYGSSQICENAYVASGIVRNQHKVGANAVIGMGAIVTRDVPANTTVIGNPARPLLRKKE